MGACTRLGVTGSVVVVVCGIRDLVGVGGVAAHCLPLRSGPLQGGIH